MEPELQQNRFWVWPQRDIHGQVLYVREERAGIRFLVVHSFLNEPVGWSCEVYESRTTFLSGAFPVDRIGPETFLFDLILILQCEGLI